MSEMILETVKKLVGLDVNYDAFDQDIVIFVNSTFDTLKQIGVQVDGYVGTDDDRTWESVFTDCPLLSVLKNYIAIKVRLAFDPPLNASILKAMEEQAKEYEWRINLEAEIGGAYGSQTSGSDTGGPGE